VGLSPGSKKLNDDIEFDEPVYIVSNNIEGDKTPDNHADTVSNIEMDEPTTITVKAVDSRVNTDRKNQ
jgi:hypothetical protein